MEFLMGIIIGFVLGNMAGAVVMCLCVVAKDKEED